MDLKFDTDETQTYHCSWRNTTRTMVFMGLCIVCDTRTYAFTDGENDPRGPLGDNAYWPFTAEAHGYLDSLTDVPCCAICANDYDNYKIGLAYAEREWRNSGE